MEGQKKFSSTLFGFKKGDVNTYVLALGQEFEHKFQELNEKNEQLLEQNRELEKKVSELEEERAFISDALLKAKRQAEAIIAEAEEQSKMTREETQRELETLRTEMRREKERVEGLRNAAREALAYYERQLGEIEV